MPKPPAPGFPFYATSRLPNFGNRTSHAARHASQTRHNAPRAAHRPPQATHRGAPLSILENCWAPFSVCSGRAFLFEGLPPIFGLFTISVFLSCIFFFSLPRSPRSLPAQPANPPTVHMLARRERWRIPRLPNVRTAQGLAGWTCGEEREPPAFPTHKPSRGSQVGQTGDCPPAQISKHIRVRRLDTPGAPCLFNL